MIKSIVTLVLVICFSLSNVAAQEFTRLRTSLNQQAWKFKREEVKGAHKAKFNDSNWLDISIPHDFNGGVDGVHNDVFSGRFDFKNDPDQRAMYKGPGMYRTHFTVDKSYESKRIFIDFEAVSLEATVWVNGKLAGSHQGGYTAFSIDATDFVKFGKENTLVVKADNTNNKAMAPWMADEQNAFPFSFDYAIYGGIYRDVWLTVADEVLIEKVFNTPVCGGQAAAVLNIETLVKNYSSKEKRVTIKTKVFNPKGKEVSTLIRNKNIASGATESIKQVETSIGDLFYWSPESPDYYKVYSTLSIDGKEIDQKESVFGFRYYSLSNNQPFLLNGDTSFIRGVNRHQDMEGIGYALSNEQHIADVTLLKEAGFNFIRHAHYPADPVFATEAMKQGMMLWLEIPLTGSTSDDPLFLENCKQQLKEMIEQNYNNPAVILWGIGNESDRSGTVESVTNHVFSELTKYAKEIDPSRLVTGCNYKYESNQKIVDIYAPQDWGGWYYGSADAYVPGKIIGEYGSDIDYNIRTSQQFSSDKDYSASGKPEFWSQEYGAFLHEYKVSIAEENKNNFPGQCVWVAFDFASPRMDRGSNPVPYMNQKGLLLHDHKTKKDVYYFYQSMYRDAEEFPMVYIIPGEWTKGAGEETAITIGVYSNCDTVVLYDGDKKISLGERTKTAGPRGDTRFEWSVDSITGDKIIAEGISNGKVVTTQTIQITKK